MAGFYNISSVLWELLGCIDYTILATDIVNIQLVKLLIFSGV